MLQLLDHLERHVLDTRSILEVYMKYTRSIQYKKALKQRFFCTKSDDVCNESNLTCNLLQFHFFFLDDVSRKPFEKGVQSRTNAEQG